MTLQKNVKKSRFLDFEKTYKKRILELCLEDGGRDPAERVYGQQWRVEDRLASCLRALRR